ncbi:alpha/beta hydrolase [Pseudonocardia yuanmonensis]|uniref:Alpha/beta hydrolase n=1 Tax=Pseudonocardia yuanmonensis TaxID=1095914 RepID=A0ABP8WMU3_9PSEU
MRTEALIDGFALAYDRSGTGPPVVLLHGWPGDRTDFNDVVKAMGADGSDLIRPDLRGFGESHKLTGGDYSADGQVRSVLGLLDELEIEHAVLCGYDVGSRVAQLLATRHPERVSAMVLAPPLPGIGRRVLEPDAVQEFWYQSFHRLGLADELVDGRLEAVRANLRHFWNHWSGPGFEVSADRLDHLAVRYSAPGAFTASIGWYRAGAATVVRSLAETAPERRIVAPTAVLWPEHDPLFPRAWADRAGEWFADAEVSDLPGVGHFVPVEAPEAFAGAIRRALAR